MPPVITLSLFEVGWISLTATRISMAHLTLLSYVAARLVIALDRIPGTCLLLKPWCLQIEFPGFIFPHIPYMRTVAFIQSYLECLWHHRAIMLCTHYTHTRPSVIKGSLMPPPPFCIFYPGKNAMYVHLDRRMTFIGFCAARNQIQPLMVCS